MAPGPPSASGIPENAGTAVDSAFPSNQRIGSWPFQPGLYDPLLPDASDTTHHAVNRLRRIDTSTRCLVHIFLICCPVQIVSQNGIQLNVGYQLFRNQNETQNETLEEAVREKRLFALHHPVVIRFP